MSKKILLGVAIAGLMMSAAHADPLTSSMNITYYQIADGSDPDFNVNTRSAQFDTRLTVAAAFALDYHSVALSMTLSHRTIVLTLDNNGARLINALLRTDRPNAVLPANTLGTGRLHKRSGAN